MNVTTGPSPGGDVISRSGSRISGCPFRPGEFRLDDPAIQADPYGYYSVLRDQEPVLRTTVGDQTWWVLSRQADVLKALMDPKTFSSRTLPDAAILFSDPPEHDRLRAMVAPWFSRTSIQDLSEQITEQAEALIGRVAQAGRCDVVGDVAEKLTVTMISGMLGIPPEAVERLHATRALRTEFLMFLQATRSGVEPPPQARAAMETVNSTLGDIIDGSYPDGSLVADLIGHMNRGDLTRAQCMSYVQILFGAGHSTTTDLIANAAYVLTGRTGDLDRMMEDGTFAVQFLEEVLRTRPSFHRIPRVTTRDVTVADVLIPAGSMVRLLLASANRDPASFEDPETFDPDKKRRQHLAFGRGIHTCLGSTLARLEATIALQVLSRHVAALSLDPHDAPTPQSGGTFNNFGFRRLPVLLHARRR